MIATHNASEKRVLGCEAEGGVPLFRDAAAFELLSADGTHFLFRFGSHLRHRIYTHDARPRFSDEAAIGAMLIRAPCCGRDNEGLLATYARCTMSKPTHVNSLGARCFAELFWLISAKVMPLPALQQAAQKSAEIVALRAPKLKRNTRGHGSRTERG